MGSVVAEFRLEVIPDPEEIRFVAVKPREHHTISVVRASELPGAIDRRKQGTFSPAQTTRSINVCRLRIRRVADPRNITHLKSRAIVYQHIVLITRQLASNERDVLAYYYIFCAEAVDIQCGGTCVGVRELHQ